jgi:hypothetical protein
MPRWWPKIFYPWSLSPYNKANRFQVEYQLKCDFERMLTLENIKAELVDGEVRPLDVAGSMMVWTAFVQLLAWRV